MVNEKLEQITESTSLDKLVSNERIYPILQKYGVPCIDCPMMQDEFDQLNLKKVCELYGINYKKIIEEINGVLKK